MTSDTYTSLLKMIAKIKYQECFDKYEKFPRADNAREEFFYPDVVANYILLLPSKSAQGHAKSLANELTRLIARMDVERLIFVGDQRRAWRYQDNPYPPVQEALDYLERNNVSKTFDGALDISVPELTEFFRHLFWLGRCNAALPIFHFMDVDQSILGSICKYGNVHVSTLTTEADQLLLEVKEETRFIDGSGKQCYSTFSKSSRITGRQTTV